MKNKKDNQEHKKNDFGKKTDHRNMWKEKRWAERGNKKGCLRLDNINVTNIYSAPFYWTKEDGGETVYYHTQYLCSRHEWEGQAIVLK